jgi:signal transduction histidine kinase/CheY-like chemotaxis protein/PAS domain-containing protein
MAGGWKRHAVTAIGPYAAGALAVGTSMFTHATPLATGVLLAESAAISLLCGALRSSRDRASASTAREAEARVAAARAKTSEAEARARLHGVFDAATDLMMLLDDDLAVVDSNRASLVFFDRRKEELVGFRSDRLVAPQDRTAWLQHWRQNGAGPASRCEVSFVAAGGAPHLFEVTSARGIRPGLHLAMLRDVEGRRRGEELARFLSEASDVLAGSLDCDATLAAVARLAVPQIADWAAVDMLDGDDLRRIAVARTNPSRVERESLFRPRSGRTDAAVGRVVRMGVPEICEQIQDEPWTEDSVDCDDSGQLRPTRFASTMCVPLRVQGRPVGAISLARTEGRRQFRTEDLDFARELAHRASAALENARTFRESQEANRVKDEFLATISHELRTPLNAILGWTTMLRRKPDVDAKKALDTIERNARAQMRLIEDVLDVSRAVTGKLQIETSEIDLVEVLRASLEVVAPMADGREVALDTHIDGGPCRLSGDADRLQQAFWNVLTNAIKFTGKGGRVGVRLERADSRVEVIFVDTGRGIPADFLPFVFDRFRQADSSTTRAEGGLGLGLAIVKHIVELHGGTVSAHSRGEGYGTTFTIALPMHAAAPISTPPGTTKASSGVYLSPGGTDKAEGLSGIRVLVCDDDEDARDLLVAILAAAGATPQPTSSGGAALEAFRAFTPHVLISDVGMPDIDGYQLIGQVRGMTEEEGGQTPAIALTAYARREDELKALLAGYQVHVTKPIDPVRLIAIVANLVGRPLVRNRERPGN